MSKEYEKCFEKSVCKEARHAYTVIKNEMATLEALMRTYEKWGTFASEKTMISCLGRIADCAAKANYEAYCILEGYDE